MMNIRVAETNQKLYERGAAPINQSIQWHESKSRDNTPDKDYIKFILTQYAHQSTSQSVCGAPAA